MKCELNISGRVMTEHDVPPEWIATNKLGVSFQLCDVCVAAYKKEHPNWQEKGIKFVPLKRSEREVVRNSSL